ncbi:hypothetical protein M432DRAFT_123647 [Thermoascus aurantiacus ATCC 26904]
MLLLDHIVAMPRPKQENRCQTCRIRKVKCDGTFPVCQTCRKSGRVCERSFRSPVSSHRTTESPELLLEELRQQGGSFSDLPSPDYPRHALRDPRIASTFRHYISSLAPWYDLNDRLRRFEDTVPLYALSNPLLFSAVLAFSAVHLARLLPSHTEFQYIAEFYHLESVRRLIAITDNRNDELVRDEATLASTCLLRSYEILAQSVGSQSHLHGSFSFLVGQQINLGSDLLSAGFWNYLREDITVALIDKRPLKIDLSTVWMPRPVEDDDWSNMISLLLGKVINICLGDDARTVSFSEWKSLKDQVDEWRRSLPASFEPVSPLPTGGHPKSSFPELWLFRGWHIAGLQYYHTAMTILTLSEPGSASLNAWRRTLQMQNIHRELEYHAVQLCALAISNDSSAARVNAFGPISFCGVWIKDPAQRNELLSGLREWEKTIAWPVEAIVRALSTSWSIESLDSSG